MLRQENIMNRALHGPEVSIGSSSLPASSSSSAEESIGSSSLPASSSSSAEESIRSSSSSVEAQMHPLSSEHHLQKILEMSSNNPCGLLVERQRESWKNELFLM
jgi:hypothetical protein